MYDRQTTNAQIIAAWRAERPITSARALEIAQGMFPADSKEKQQFEKWFEKFGAQQVERVNRA